MTEIVPLFVFEKLAELHGCQLEQLGYDPTDGHFVHQTEDRRLIIGHLDVETRDVYYAPDDRPMFDGDVHVVNLDNPDLDYKAWTPKVDWNRGDCSGLVSGDVEHLWHPETGDTTTARKAKAICRFCPISNTCLQWAIVTNQQNGIWGGLGEDERRPVRREFVADPDGLADLCDRIAVTLRDGERPHILRFRNTPGVTHGKVSTWNRGCDHNPERLKVGKSPACKACRVASMMAASRRRQKANQL